MEFGLLIALLGVFLAWRALVQVRALKAELTTLRAELAALGPPRAAPPMSGATAPEADPPETALPETVLPETVLPETGPLETDTVPQPTPPRDALAAPPWSRRPRPVQPATGNPTPSAWGAAGQGDGHLAQLGAWLRDNWIYPAAGAALVLSGVFLVQYAVETGLLTPQARVILALVLALALGAGGEWLRHRPLAGPVLPATLTGSGLVIAMAAVLAALHLYQMIGPGPALGALALLSLVAIGLGWLHGPMLAGLGLVAGTAAPFALGGSGPPPAALFGYFALLALTGLGIDAARRWGWVSWLALVLTLAAMVLWRQAGGDALALAVALVVVAGGAMTLPFGRVAPVAEGPRALGRAAPRMGVRASFAASAVAAGGLALLVPGIAGPVGLAVLAGLAAIWCRRAPALADQILLPLLALPLWVFWQDLTRGPVLRAFTAPLPPESALPLQVSLILGLAALAGLACLWRGEAEDPGRHAPWTLAGLAFPGATLVALETLWRPAGMLGAYPWALHAMALAGLATALALRYAARDGGQGARLGASAAAAFALVALGLMLMIGLAALTLALAVLMAAAAAMDRRFDIPALGVFLALSGFVLTWRLVLDPGLGWLINDAATPEMLLSLAATLAGPLAALGLGQDLPDEPLRRHSRLMVETTLVAAAAISAAVILARFVGDRLDLHALLGLQALVLIVLAWVQVRRAALPVLPRLRLTVAWFLGLLAALALALALGPLSPLFGTGFLRSRVAGGPLLNDLILAYLAPGAALILLGGWAWLRVAGWGLAAIWAGMAIRHLWQGANLYIGRGVAQGELYAYTFALLTAGAVLLARAVLTGRPELRKLGLALIAAAAAKAFLIDAAGLDGLLRVAAFLGLGLSLAGLAWVNGWAVAREGRGPAAPDP